MKPSFGICDCMGRGYFTLAGQRVACLACNGHVAKSSRTHHGRRHATQPRLMEHPDTETLRHVRRQLIGTQAENRRLKRDMDSIIEQGEKHGINLQPIPRLGRPRKKTQAA